jgi:hypothetical protein
LLRKIDEYKIQGESKSSTINQKILNLCKGLILIKNKLIGVLRFLNVDIVEKGSDELGFLS